MRRKRPKEAPPFALGGRWHAACFNAWGHLLWTEDVLNDVTDQGLADLLSVHFAGGSQHSWYAGLIDGSGGTPTLSASDTLASHGGWTEVASYSGNRKAWTPAVSGPVAVNALAMAYQFTAGATLAGLFLCSAPSGSSGVLWSTAPFTANRAVYTGQTFRLIYRARAAAGGVRP